MYAGCQNTVKMSQTYRTMLITFGSGQVSYQNNQPKKAEKLCGVAELRR